MPAEAVVPRWRPTPGRAGAPPEVNGFLSGRRTPRQALPAVSLKGGRFCRVLGMAHAPKDVGGQ